MKTPHFILLCIFISSYITGAYAQDQMHPLFISNTRVKKFLQEYDLDIPALWAHEVDKLSADEINASDKKIPVSLQNLSATIATKIQEIFNRLTRKNIEQLLEKPLDIKRYYRLSSINLIQNYDDEIFDSFEIEAYSFDELKENLALIIASHFCIENLEARFHLEDQTLLSEPFCALCIQPITVKSISNHLQKSYVVFDNTHEQHVARKQLLFDHQAEQVISKIKALLLTYLAISGNILPGYITSMSKNTPFAEEECFEESELYLWNLPNTSTLMNEKAFCARAYSPAHKIKEIVTKYNISPHCLKLGLDPLYIHLAEICPQGKPDHITCGPRDVSYPFIHAENGFTCCSNQGCTDLPIEACQKGIAPAPWHEENVQCITSAAELLQMLSDFETGNLDKLEHKPYMFFRKHV